MQLTYIWCLQASPTTSSTSGFLCRQPMQCYLSEHLCFSPNVPLPCGAHSAGDRNPSIWDLDPHRLMETPVSRHFLPKLSPDSNFDQSQDGFDVDVGDPMSLRGFCYERFSNNELGRDIHEALDIVITGEVSKH
jgi:hypothetical protein